MHEAELYDRNCFITLTYDDQHLPSDYGVHVRHLQLFMKRLRKAYPYRIRFYACGEYGEQSLRPHYHALLFNHDFLDKTVWSKKRDILLFTSEKLSELWPYGLATLGTVTFQSAAYCARYTLKKIGGDRAATHYLRQHPITGKIHTVHPEFSVMSRRPGIGYGWLQKYKSDIYPSDFVVVDGHRQRTPRYYDQKLTEEECQAAKRLRKRAAVKHKDDQTKERLQARADVRDARMQTIKRGL